MEAIGKKPTGTRVVGILFTTGRDDCVSLCVFRPDVVAVCYRVNERSVPLAIATARHESGLDVSDLHAVKDLPKWAQRQLWRTIGFQFNWKLLGWVLVKKKKADRETEAA